METSPFNNSEKGRIQICRKMSINEPDSCYPPSYPTHVSSSTQYLCQGTPNNAPHLYNDPRLLSCLHSFCKTCLNDCVTNNTIKCPTCTESTVLTDKLGIDDLPVNTRLVHEIEATNIITKLTSSTSIVCEECITNPPPAVSYCIDCEEFICNDCNIAHKRKRTFIDHKLIDINELTISSLLTKSKPSLCPRHTKEPLDLYCKECCTINCRLCVLTNHSGHTCTDIDKIADTNKQELQKHLLPLTKAISEIQSSLEKNATAQLQLKESTQHAKVTIEEKFEILFDALKKRKEKLLQDVQHVSDIKQDILLRKRNELEKESEKMSSSVQMIETTLATYTPEELVSTCGTLKTYLDKKINSYDSTITHPPSVDSSEIVLSVDTPVSIVKQINQFGSVGPIDPCSSVIIGQQVTRCVAGKKYTITLEARNVFGERFNKGGDKVNVTLIGNGCSIQGTVVDKGTGRYELSCTPPSPGKYQLHVTINNKHISNSPFTISVRYRPYCDYCQLKAPVSTYKVDRYPLDICTSSDGTVYVSCDTSICKYNSNGTLIATIGRDIGTMEFKSYNFGIAVKGDMIYVANSSEGKIIQLTTNGKLIKTFGTAGWWSYISVDEEGKVYVTVDRHIDIYTSNGTLMNTIQCGIDIRGIALDVSGNIYVAAINDGLVAVYSSAGELLRQFGKGKLTNPWGITVDEEGYCLVSEYINGGQLKIFNPQDQLIHSVGNLRCGIGVCIDNESNVFVSSSYANTIYKF